MVPMVRFGWSSTIHQSGCVTPALQAALLHLMPSPIGPRERNDTAFGSREAPCPRLGDWGLEPRTVRSAANLGGRDGIGPVLTAPSGRFSPSARASLDERARSRRQGRQPRGTKRSALTSVSTRARCWLDDAAGDHNILRSTRVQFLSVPRARQTPPRRVPRCSLSSCWWIALVWSPRNYPLPPCVWSLPAWPVSMRRPLGRTSGPASPPATVAGIMSWRAVFSMSAWIESTLFCFEPEGISNNLASACELRLRGSLERASERRGDVGAGIAPQPR